MRRSATKGKKNSRRPGWAPAAAGDVVEVHAAREVHGTMTDQFIHLVAYQLVTLSGTGVSVLD